MSCGTIAPRSSSTVILRVIKHWRRERPGNEATKSRNVSRSLPESILGMFSRSFLGSILGTFLKTWVYVPVIMLRSKHRDTVVRTRNDPAYTNSLFLSHLAFHTQQPMRYLQKGTKRIIKRTEAYKYDRQLFSIILVTRLMAINLQLTPNPTYCACGEVELLKLRKA